MRNVAFVFFLAALALFLTLRSPRRERPSEILGPNVVEKFTEEQRTLLDLHNSMRESKGMKALEMDESMCDYAQRHAEYMAEKERLVHSSMSRLQESCGGETVGENIAWGQETASGVVSSWMYSPMHRWNILGSSYKRVGFGVKEDSHGRKYWCAVFSN